MSYQVVVNRKGVDFIRAVIAMGSVNAKSWSEAATLAAERHGEHVARVVRAAQAAGSAGPGSWGAALATPAMEEFFGAVRQQSIIGKLQGLREMPLNVRTVGVTGGASAYWVAAGAPKPVSKMAMAGDTLSPLKVCALSVVSKDILKHGSVQAETRINGDLTRACVELIDQSFTNPSFAGVADESPASVTSGVVPLESVGDASMDIAALLGDFGGDLASAYFITDPVTAAQFPLVRDANGNSRFPDAGPRGGSILQIPLIISRSSPRDSSGGQIALVDPTGIAYGAEGIRITKSEQASIAMSDAPDNPTADTTVLVSLWQMDLVGLLVEIGVSWKVVRPGSVSYITGASYGAAS